MKQSLIDELSRLIDLKFEHKDTKDNILLVDRGNIDPIVRGCLVSQIFQKLLNFNVLVLLDERPESWRRKIYQSIGIRNFVKSPRVKNFFLYPYVFFKSLFLFTIKYTHFLIFKNFRWMIDNLQVSEIHVGDLIYDTYLRYDLTFLRRRKYDLKLMYIFFQTIYKTVFIENLIKEKSVKQIIVGTATYSCNSSVVLRLAAKKGIPAVFVAWFLVVFYNDYKRVFLSRQKIWPKDIDSFNLPEDWLEQYERYARSKYQGKLEHPDFINAFRNKTIIEDKEKLFEKISKKSSDYSKYVLIAPHCFSDASHETCEQIFDDYYQHFIKTLEHIKKSRHLDDTLWIVNPHPSSHHYSEEGLVEKTIKEYDLDNLILFPKDINVFSALKIVDTVITSNGSIGLEFPAGFEKKSIIVGDSAWAKLGFNEEPKNEKEYYSCLDNIKNILPMTEEEKILAKKTFFFYECLQIESYETSIIPSRRFMSSEQFVTEIIEKLKTKNFANDIYYQKVYKLISSDVKNRNKTL